MAIDGIFPGDKDSEGYQLFLGMAKEFGLKKTFGGIEKATEEAKGIYAKVTGEDLLLSKEEIEKKYNVDLGETVEKFPPEK